MFMSVDAECKSQSALDATDRMQTVLKLFCVGMRDCTKSKTSCARDDGKDNWP